jgi:hypothetical protein
MLGSQVMLADRPARSQDCRYRPVSTDSGMRSRILYIGRATALRSRVASYWSDLSDRA